MDIGFTGTRTALSRKQVETLEALLGRHKINEPTTTTFRHGDCIGADAYAHALAIRLDIPVTIHPPIDSSRRAFCGGAAATWTEKEFLARNRDIVDNCDILFACPAGGSRGTIYTINYALSRGRDMVVIWP